MKDQLNNSLTEESMHDTFNQSDFNDNNDSENDSPQPLVDLIVTSRGENSWTEKDVEALKEGALSEIKHYQQTMKKKVKIQRDEALITVKKNEALLKTLNEDKERVALEIMKGLSVNDAFIQCCGVLEFDDEDEDSSESQEEDQS